MAHGLLVDLFDQKKNNNNTNTNRMFRQRDWEIPFAWQLIHYDKKRQKHREKNAHWKWSLVWFNFNFLFLLIHIFIRSVLIPFSLFLPFLSLSFTFPCFFFLVFYRLKFNANEKKKPTGACRRRCLSLLKTLRDRHLDLPGNPVTSYHMKTLLLYECEKHPREAEWEDNCIADRINGIFMQLISCLQCRRCPHYFLPNMDLFKGKSPNALENAARQVWRLLRIMLTNTRCLEEL